LLPDWKQFLDGSSAQYGEISNLRVRSIGSNSLISGNSNQGLTHFGDPPKRVNLPKGLLT
jgi:hypothetical protein